MEAGIHELTAGYALDALDPDERRAYEAHLAGCEHVPARSSRRSGTTTEALAVAASGPGAEPGAARAHPRGRRAPSRRRTSCRSSRRRRRARARARRGRGGRGRRRARGRALGVELSSELDETRAALERERAAAAVLADPAARTRRARRQGDGPARRRPDGRPCSSSTASTRRPPARPTRCGSCSDGTSTPRLAPGSSPGGTARESSAVDGTVDAGRRRRGHDRDAGRRRCADDAADRRLGAGLSTHPLCGTRSAARGLESVPLAGSERQGDAASAAPGSQASSCGAAGRPLRAGGAVVHLRARARGRERDPGARPGRAALRRRHRRLRLERHARVLAVLRGEESRVLVDTDDIAPIMRQAIVSVEDQRFFEHNGVDLRGIAPRALAGRPPAGDRRGRLDDHAAVRQERVHPERADARAQGARGGARVAARAALDEGPDPHRVPEHDLLRERRVRHPAGGARRTSRRARRTSTLARGRAARRASRPTRRSTTRSTNPRNATLRRRHVLAMMLEQGKITPRQFARADKAPLPEPRGHPPPRHAGAGAVLRQLREGPARRELRRRARVRRRAQGHDDDRPRPPAEGARRRSRRCSATRTARPPRSSRSTRRRER